jgi:hypothetical protein
MSNIKGGMGLHGPDKQQDALRTYVAALTIRAVRAKHRIQAKGSEPSTSARNGVPMYDRACQTLTLSIRRNRTCPRVCLAGE